MTAVLLEIDASPRQRIDLEEYGRVELDTDTEAPRSDEFLDDPAHRRAVQDPMPHGLQ